MNDIQGVSITLLYDVFIPYYLLNHIHVRFLFFSFLRQQQYRLLALDCEMVRTCKGLEVARVTVVNGEDLATLYDEYVQPDNEVLDYVTQYSGIAPEHLAGVTTRLADVQQHLLSLLSPANGDKSKGAILVGHGLSNDLHCLQMVHTRVIDTVIAFPHMSGPPYKNKLKYLAKKYLNLDIQQSSKGHDSAVDARTALRLVLLKLQDGSVGSAMDGCTPTIAACDGIVAMLASRSFFQIHGLLAREPNLHMIPVRNGNAREVVKKIKKLTSTKRTTPCEVVYFVLDVEEGEGGEVLQTGSEVDSALQTLYTVLPPKTALLVALEEEEATRTSMANKGNGKRTPTASLHFKLVV